jgi:hypothetical protein
VLTTLLRLAAPPVALMLLPAVIAAGEAAFVGRLGADPLAGVSLSFPLVMLMTTLSAGACAAVAVRLQGPPGLGAERGQHEFGLGGSVWSSDRNRAFEVATRLNAGAVWVNKHLDLGPDIPYAGVKQSGIGTGLSPEGLEAFTQATIINMAK